MIVVAMVVTVVTALAAVVRLMLGPSLVDRIVAGSVIGTMLFALILLFGLLLDEPMMIDVALVYSVLHFADMLIYAKFLGRHRGFM
ncbi:MAG: hypothetical protein EA404_13240 [Spirochaetaceae bacterium]|nr:MAG: hypothetical protein EA404_13240 [Spirochaetaceae bacterium]